MLFRRGNDSDRQQTILASGEPGWALDTKRLWIGDGVTPGGYPALSAADFHLRYTDASGQTIGAGPQRLDINVPGLASSLVGDEQGRHAGLFFHGDDRPISTNHPLQFTDQLSQTEPTIYFGGTANQDFEINRSQSGTINIGNAIYIDVDESGNGSVRFLADSTTFEASKLVFAESDRTIYEDNTIDLNVNIVNGVSASPGNGGTSEKTGLYFGHKNYLSAGHMSVGHAGDYNGWSTIQLQPPVYHSDWCAGETALLARLDRPTNTTASFTNTNHTMIVGSDGNACKPLVFKSARPGEYTGDANLVFETGLIVYGEGADDIGGWNGYLINQSVDTGAKPTFAGITIEDENGNPGDSLTVRSGGTGVNTLAAGGVLLAHGTDPEGAVRSMVLGSGEFVTGSDTGAKNTKLVSNSWLNITSDNTTGVVTIDNRLVPGANFVNATTTKADYFDKWYNVATNTGNVNPGNNKTSIEFIGDGVSLGSTDQSDVNISTSTIAGNKVGINHKLHAAGLFDANVVGSAKLATFTAPPRDAINSITFNKAGHISNIGTFDPGGTYLELDHVGTQDKRTSGSVTAPADVTPSASNSTPNPDPSITQNQAGHVTVVTGLNFNDYGTVKSTSKHNLQGSYYNKKEIGGYVHGLNADITQLQQELGSAAFLKLNASSATTGASLVSSWKKKGKIGFSANTGADITTISQQDAGFQINCGSHAEFILPANTHATDWGAALKIKHGSDVAAWFTNRDCRLNWDNVYRIKTTSVGVEINSECHAGSFHGDGTNLDLSNNASIPAGNFVDVTGGTFTGQVNINHIGAGEGNEALRITGNTYSTSTIQAAYLHARNNITATGDVIAFTTSDKRLKDNLTLITKPLEKISKISGYEFDWNDKQDTYSGHDVGVVAQEVEQVLPEVVTEREDGLKAVKYDKLVPLLIESIKELTAKVEKLESQLK
jgi:hypothetical protein